MAIADVEVVSESLTAEVDMESPKTRSDNFGGNKQTVSLVFPRLCAYPILTRKMSRLLDLELGPWT
jgi:hypothetical protein